MTTAHDGSTDCNGGPLIAPIRSRYTTRMYGG